MRAQRSRSFGIASIDRRKGVEEVLSHAGCHPLPCRIELYPMPPADLLSLDDAALKALIRARLSAAPRQDPIADWRFGALAPEHRQRLRAFFPQDPVPAAVLVPLVERESGLAVLLTRRAGHLAHHAGQISFPGGRLESDDPDVVSAALRETEEEIGLDRARVQVVGFLPDHLVISGYRVTPVVGFIQPGFELHPDHAEVAEVFEMPLRFLLDERNHVRRVREWAGEAIELTDLPYGPHLIWGATAGMLMTFWQVLHDGGH